MKYTKFGRTGLMVSRLCLGTATFGKQSSEAVSVQILDRAADAEVNFIDSADGYPMGADFELAGRTEEILGRWLKGKRDRFIVATKGGAPMGPAAWEQGASRKRLLDAIDASLRRLGTDYVDLYQLHFDDPGTPLDETLEALDTIIRSGKARYVGASNMLAYRLARATGISEARRIVRFASIQPRYSLLFREIERELLPLAAEESLAVIPFNPLAGGLLSGKYRADDAPTGGRFASAEVGEMFSALYKQRYWQDQKFATVEAVREISAQSGIPIATLAVAWVLAHPQITSAILGASKPEQLADTLASSDVALDPAVKARLDDLTAEYRKGDAVR